MAGDAITSGAGNSAFGLNALGTASTGADSTAVGRAAGLALTTGGTCTFLGATADTTLATAANSTCVGFGATVALSNTMVFGNASVITVRPGSDAACDLGLTGNRWNNGWFANVRVTADNGLLFTNATDGAGASTGTLTNAPSAGNPAFWVRVVINAANRFIPCWA
jgi:hypothetical protein